MRQLLSIVVPCFNEQENIAALFSTLLPILELLDTDYEVLAVDDGSDDATWHQLLAHHQNEPRIKLIRLSRNFGKEMAVACGFQHARGHAVIVMDSDLQDPPEIIPDMIAQWRAGFEVVNAVRTARAKDRLLKRGAAWLFYHIINWFSEVPIMKHTGDFRLLDKKVVLALNALPERTRFMKGLFSWIGFRQTAVDFERPGRYRGTSKWRFWRLWNYALEGLVSFTTLPLRIWSYIGIFVAAGSFFYGLFLVIRTLWFGIDVPGYASLMVAILFLNGMVLMSIGVLGEFVSRIFIEVKARPLYCIQESIGIEIHP